MPAEWKSGDRLWLVHLFAPFGHTEVALADLEKTTFAEGTFKMHRTQPDENRAMDQNDSGVAEKHSATDIPWLGA